MKKITVVIVNYNVKHYIEQCLISLQWALRDIDSEIIVVDNHSKDGSVEFLSDKFGDSITLINSNHNLGFAKANNMAIRNSDSEYVLMLNPDTIVTEESIRETIDFMDSHPRAGSLGVRMLKSDGSNAMESRRGIPTPMASFYKIVGLCSRYPKSARFAKYYMGGIPWDTPQRIDVVSGAFCLLRRQTLDEVGLLDEDYFMYGEDIDLSYRILQKGWENWYLPSVILHYKGESTHKSSFRYIHVFYNAMLIFFRKHYGHLSLFTSLPINIAIYGKATMALFQMVYKGLRDSLGLRSNRNRQQPLYVFIGLPYSMKTFRSIAKHKALDADFVEGTVGTLPDGHLGLSLPDDKPVVIVYDVHAYSYKDIFSLFSRRPQSNVTIGTYDNNTHKIITECEVIVDNLSERRS